MALPVETVRLLADKASAQILRDRYFFWLLFCTGAVAIGVLLEELGELDLKKRGLIFVIGLFRYQLKIPTYRLKSWLKRSARIGWFLVVIGVIGEGVFEGFVSREDTRIQSVDGALLSLTQQQASDIGDRADQLAALLKTEQETTARFQKQASESESRLEKLHAFMTPRSLTQKEMNELRDAFKPFADATVPIVVVGSATSGLFIQVWRSLKDVGFEQANFQMSNGGMAYGMGASSPRKYAALVDQITGVLLKARIGPMVGPPGTAPDGDPVRIFIGDIRTAPLPSLPRR